ncbi:prepilin-type N-terminal cleavage/methylation domain-containing protein [Thalassotalea sp. PS06]|uniref:type IV pilus modification PilV family protein n=1 Tax=Thalassotalea sp. PS06 TaxID=2594005 RepID=UPI00116537D2|nr:prepilin-type N-terminal cleavage/methylation domain-containing protein [Thalassotalea sp. PS06]QDP02040.1 prepilin-type N-terminal cleavage/methylation domain-containing protein [Thalassotalea sp. PS06]
MKIIASKQTSHNSGFSLIEVLVVLMLFAISILGISKFQLASSFYQKQGQYQFAAQQALMNISTAIIRNHHALSSYQAANNNPNSTFINCSQQTCNDNQLAYHDLASVRAHIEKIPNVTLSITEQQDQVKITVFWQEKTPTSPLSECILPRDPGLHCSQLMLLMSD